MCLLHQVRCIKGDMHTRGCVHGRWRRTSEVLHQPAPLGGVLVRYLVAKSKGKVVAMSKGKVVAKSKGKVVAMCKGKVQGKGARGR